MSLAILIGFACGPSFDPNEFMSFFQPEASNAQAGDQRYFFSPQLYNDADTGEMDNDSVVIDENVRAWATYIGGDLSESVVSRALYSEEANAVDQLTAALQQNHPKAVAYLTFAWSVDDGQSDPWAAIPLDSIQLPLRLNAAKAAYRTTTDAFLKERYGFQAVKLAAEQRDYSAAQQLYDQLVKPLPTHTFMSDWALCRRAGASLALGDTALAIYEFAQVFDRCPSRRKAAETSLRKYGISFQEKALQYAKTAREQAAVYALCAIQPGRPSGREGALDILSQLVQLMPQNPLIELIMAREINRNEYYFFTSGEQYSYNNLGDNLDSAAFVNRKQEATSYFDKLRQFALETAENKAVGNPAFWYTAGAYLDYIGNEYKAAHTHLDLAAQAPATNKALKTQITVQRMLLLAAETTVVTPDVENQLINFLDDFDSTGNFRLNNAFVTVCKQFSDRYQQAEPKKSGWFSGCSRPKTQPVDGPGLAKAYLLTVLTTQPGSDAYFASTSDPEVIEDSVSAATIQQVIAYAEQPNQTDFDKRLLKLAGLTTDGLHLSLGRRLLIEHRYAEAADAFAKVNPKTWQHSVFTTYFQENPFAVKMPQLQVTTTGSTPGQKAVIIAESTDNPYTPVQFARRMADLEQQAKAATGDQAAELYYQLGCGAWNLTWYGNAWILAKSFWSAGEPSVYDAPANPIEKQKRYDTLMNTDYYTTAQAGTYFEQSAKAAKTPVLANRSAYMAARCEANAFALQRSIEQYRNGYVYEEDSTFVRSMQTLRQKKYARLYTNFFKNHTHSPFHQEMIRECPFYEDFLSFGKETGQ